MVYQVEEKKKTVAKADSSDTMNQKEVGIDVHLLGKINLDIYKVVAEGITTDEVIITDERINHIKDHHPNDFENYGKYIPNIIKHPDYVIRASKPNTALVLKQIDLANVSIKLVLRLVTSNDLIGYKNSIMTFMKIDDKEWNRLLRNKEILYKNK